MKTIWLFFAAVLLFVTISCKGESMGEWRYLDGSGNSYRISVEKTPELHYEPVQPEFSSSGVYSGGKEKRVSLQEHHLRELERLLKNALERKTVHIQNRVMMSGMIIQGNKEREPVILAPDASEKKELELYLKFLLKQEQ